MESSKEQIEAQLCAYIDGELNDAERAEIERHLASNPQHQSLIAELRRHSGLLQDLPRASAPLELNEALCGQLERSALLNSSEEGTTSGLSINRWPQITAVAAVLMLAIGLGIVVYYVLPPSGSGTRGPLAIDEKKAHLPTTDGVPAGRDLPLAKQIRKPADVELNSAAEKNGMSDRLATNSQPEFDPAAARAGEIKSGTLITAREVDELRRRANLSLQAGNKAFNLDNSSLCLVVSASNTAAASNQVAAFFDSNQIRYMKYEDSAGVAESEAPANAAKGGVSNLAFKANGPADDRVKDAFVNRGNVAEPPAPAPSGAFGGGGAAPGAGRGGKSSEGVALQDGQSGYGRSDAKAPEQARQEDIAAKSKLETAASRGMRNATPAQVPAAVPSNDPAAGKPGAVPETEKSLAQREALAEEAKEEYRDKDKTPDLLREKEAAKKIGRSEFGELGREKGVPATDGSAQTWELKDRAARARIAAQIADNPVERNGVIIARMNRRQANQLQAVLSREQGQRAELTTVNLADTNQQNLAYAKAVEGSTPGPPASAGAVLDSSLNAKDKVRAPLAPGTQSIDAVAAIEPATEPKISEPKLDVKNDASHGSVRSFGVATTVPAEHATRRFKEAQASKNDASDVLRLKVDPLDEPVDVFIVVKGDATGGAKIELTAPKAGVEGAPSKEKK